MTPSSEPRKWRAKAAKKLLDRFPFEDVSIYMRLVGWTWATTGGHPPNAAELRAGAARHLATVVAGKGGVNSSSSGGFMARLDSDGLHLSFDIKESEFR